MKRAYPRIQILRGILFLFILAFHCCVPFSNFGWGGVEVFFVISAFFLVKKYYGNNALDLKKQFIHRIERLYPPYLIVLAVASVYVLFARTIPYDLITHLFSVQNFQWMVTGYQSALQPLTAHTWTLSVEVWCGLILLILLKTQTMPHFKTAMIVMLFSGVMYRLLTIAFHADIYTISLCPIGHFDSFAIGALLAVGHSGKKQHPKNVLLSGIGAIGVFSCIIVLAHENNLSFIEGYKLLSSPSKYLNNYLTGNIYLFISMFAAGIVGLLTQEDTSEKSGLIKQVFVKLGDNSYVLYLFHWPVLVFVKRFSGNWGIQFVTTLVITIVVTLGYGTIHQIIKKKLMEKKTE